MTAPEQAPVVPEGYSARLDQQLTVLEKLFGHEYEFLSILGEGGAGVVFEVNNRKLGRNEAFKVLSGYLGFDFGGRFTQEARTAAALDHPRIIKIYNFGESQGIFWYSMQLVGGSTLASLIETTGPLGQEVVLKLAIPLLDALEYSHSRGVIHRDIKPANILVSTEGGPFLTDFGIAKSADDVVTTKTGTMLGTPAYVSPEQARGLRVDARSDLYSFALTLYETLSGRLPFVASGIMETLMVRLNTEPEPLHEVCPSVDLRLAAVIMVALHRDPQYRWPSAEAMKAALIRAARDGGIDWSDSAFEVAVTNHPRPLLRMLRRTAELKATPPAVAPTRHPGRWVGYGVAITTLAGLGFLGWQRFGPREVAALSPGVAGKASSSRVLAEPPQTIPAPSKPLPVARPAPDPVPAASPVLRRAVVMPHPEASPAAEVKGAAQCAGQSVSMSIKVGEDGLVKSSRVLSAPHPDCARAATDVIGRWRFKPAQDAEGRPVETTISVVVPFSESP